MKEHGDDDCSSQRESQKNRGESQYRQTLAKFEMSPCSFYGVLKAERHLDSLERERQQKCRESDASVVSPIFARSEVFRLV